MTRRNGLDTLSLLTTVIGGKNGGEVDKGKAKTEDARLDDDRWMGWISAAATSAFLLNYLSAKLIWSSSTTQNYWLLVCSFDHQTIWSVLSTATPLGLFFRPPHHLVCFFNRHTIWSVLSAPRPFGLFFRPPLHLVCSFGRQAI